MLVEFLGVGCLRGLYIGKFTWLDLVCSFDWNVKVLKFGEWLLGN